MSGSISENNIKTDSNVTKMKRSSSEMVVNRNTIDRIFPLKKRRVSIVPVEVEETKGCVDPDRKLGDESQKVVEKENIKSFVGNMEYYRSQGFRRCIPVGR